jgi:hypothetical protein
VGANVGIGGLGGGVELKQTPAFYEGMVFFWGVLFLVDHYMVHGTSAWEHKRRYGAVRIRNELKKENTKVSIKRVNRLMKSRNLVSLHKQPFKVVTTNS